MRKIKKNIYLRLNPRGYFGTGLIVSAIFCLGLNVNADITNVIWQASLNGNLAIQKYDAQLGPRISIAKFTNKNFISMVGGSTSGGSTTLGTSASAGDVLGVNLDMVDGRTNLFLSLYDRTNRRNTLRITTNEVTTMISDGKNLAFTVEAPLIPTSNTWGGGFIRIAGLGRMVHGVPSALNGSVKGAFIDNRPGDLNGTTGLVLRAKLTTSNVPLRVLPQN